MKAVVLAAGKGTRFGDMTEKMPKHLIEVGGKPFLWYVLDSLAKAGIDEIGIVVSYKSEMIKDYVSANFPNLKITFIYQGVEPAGTGEAVKCARDFVGRDNFIVIMGDNIYYAEDIRAVGQTEGNCIAGFEVDNSSAYGVLVVRNGNLDRIIEKPANPPSKLINTGLYFFTQKIFNAIDKIKKSERGEYELTDAINILAKSGNVQVYKIKDHWLDFGKPEDIEKVEAFLSARRASY